MMGGIAGIGLVITYLGAAWSGPDAEGNLFDSGFLSGLGAIGNSKTGVLYTCKTSPTDTRNRWR